jgi:glutathione S-transferase
MSLTLHFHPLSSFCHKVLVALYENDTPFTPYLVDLGNEAERAKLAKLWPIGKFPVLQDLSRNQVVAESTAIIEYLDRYYPGKTRFIPADLSLADQVRLQDRCLDLYVHMQMQKIVTDRLRPAGQNDTLGVELAKSQLRVALDMLEKNLAGKTWAVGDIFTLADCAAAPALFYSNMALPFATTHPTVTAYLQRLMQRPSYARTLAAAQPYFSMVPTER